jgi:hypothetical protein
MSPLINTSATNHTGLSGGQNIQEKVYLRVQAVVVILLMVIGVCLQSCERDPASSGSDLEEFREYIVGRWFSKDGERSYSFLKEGGYAVEIRSMYGFSNTRFSGGWSTNKVGTINYSITWSGDQAKIPLTKGDQTHVMSITQLRYDWAVFTRSDGKSFEMEKLMSGGSGH